MIFRALGTRKDVMDVLQTLSRLKLSGREKVCYSLTIVCTPVHAAVVNYCNTKL